MGWYSKLVGKKFDNISVNAGLEQQKNGALLVDVREDHEWLEGHAAGAKHIPLGSLADRLHEIEKKRKVVVICKSGGRSKQAAEILVKHGYKAASIDGGTVEWAAQGLPIEKP